MGANLKLRRLISGVMVIALWAMHIPAFAQLVQQQSPAVSDSITAVGTSSVKKPPDAMRLVIQLAAEGKTLKEALEKVSQRKEAAKKKLVALGAAEGGIQFEDLRPETPNQQQLMEQAMKARMGTGKKPAPGPGGAANVRLMVTLKAQWPLTGKSPEELLTRALELQEKVKATDLAELKQASPEERERLEEQQAGGEFNFGMPAAPAPGEPAFTFVAKISDEEMASAAQAAFKSAEAKAQQLAKAAGVRLGPLRQLNSVLIPELDSSQNAYIQMIQAAAGQVQQMTGDDANEATGNQPTAVKMRLVVTASFSIK
jgi:uncharacterized protein YggE